MPMLGLYTMLVPSMLDIAAGRFEAIHRVDIKTHRVHEVVRQGQATVAGERYGSGF
jgi:hypothetical protein